MLVATFNLRIADIKGINAAQKKKYCRENKKLIGTKVLHAYEKKLYSHLRALNGNGKMKMVCIIIKMEKNIIKYWLHRKQDQIKR